MLFTDTPEQAALRTLLEGITGPHLDQPGPRALDPTQAQALHKTLRHASDVNHTQQEADDSLLFPFYDTTYTWHDKFTHNLWSIMFTHDHRWLLEGVHITCTEEIRYGEEIDVFAPIHFYVTQGA